ncbi:hypothetical protein [Streptomyces sp. NPDC001068]|uniref:hypothetical protein n=1 Tax=Streptomyces sp. NPDC001068 TaxID=3364544 RepID=UPI0036A9C66A
MIDELPWPWPDDGLEDDQPAPQPVVSYVQYEDGTLARMTTGPGVEAGLSRPGRLITEAEYDKLRGEMDDAHHAAVDALKVADQERQARAFQDLVGAGIPEATARTLSGYEGSTALA